ncbi:hypothetical protein BU17DRAFT_72491 [Hysterangium stoloniferum]|nr:hypothetical protein BU17DRAFT_72491 [Hysterangium stoloniferum]
MSSSSINLLSLLKVAGDVIIRAYWTKYFSTAETPEDAPPRLALLTRQMMGKQPSPSYPGISTPAAAIAKGKSGRNLIVCIDGTSNCSGVMLDEKSSENLLQCPPHSDPTAPIPHTPSESPSLPKKRQPPQKNSTHQGSVVPWNPFRYTSFLWISFEAVWAGLKLDHSNVAWKWDESADGVTWW